MADLLAQAKDPAEAARIQRAIDAGRNTILYHGTHTDFPATDPSKVDLGLHVGTSEQATNRLADLYRRQDPNASRGSNKFTEGAQIMPLAVRPGKSLEMADVGDWDDSVQTALALRSHPEMAKHRELIDELLDSVDYLKAANMATVEHPADRAKSWINSDDNKRALQEMNALLVGEGYGSVKYLNAAENTHGTAGAILPEYAEQLNEFRSAADDLRKLAGERKKQAAHAAITNRETAEQLLKYPKSPLGYLMPEERELFDQYASQISDIEMDPIYRSDPNSYIILNPYDQRSINAQFDPEFDLSPDLMKAEGGLVEDLPKFGKGQLFRSPKLSELIKDIRNDAGNFRAQRVERAADEIPMLDTRYSIPALDRAFRGDTSEMMTTMNPADFEKYALQLRRVDDDYIRKLGDIASSSGFNDVPYLTMIQPPPEDLPMIFGHEGRHRSRALAGLGDKSSLVRIRTGGNLKEPFPRHSAEEFFDAFKQKKGSLLHVVPEEYGGDIRKPYQLPELYAGGGLVDLARKYNKGGLIQKYQKGNLVRQWLKGYPEKSLAPLRLKNPGAGTGDPAETIAQLQQKLAAEPDFIVPDAFTRSLEVLAPRAALNNWIDTSLAKYIKRDYGSPNDPLALLAPEQRHVPLINENLRAAQTNAVWPPRRPTGDIGLSGVSSDTLDWLTNPSGRPKAYIDKVMAENPWLASLPKETILYGDVSVHDLGLQHLRDELHNAIRPDSDLPDQLRLRPESLPRVSVAQASQLVGKINAWRAANKAKADLAASMNPATFIHKEYPEQNMRWVQLRAPDELKALPEGYSIRPSNDMSRQSGRFVLRHPDGKESALGTYATEEQAIKKALGVIEGDDRFEQLQKALKYEGDTMGHCVGGYCDSVFDGTSNIYSLRDARGEPHVTVEVSNDDWVSGEAMDEIIPGSFAGYRDQMNNFDGIANIHEYIQKVHPEMFATLTRPSIVQIKGKSNNKPVDKYLPFVQDFVKSQKWGDVGDLRHTGLRRAAEAFQPYSITKARAEGIDLPDYLTEQEIADITAKLQSINKPDGMKEGGMAKKEKQSRERIRTDVPWIENAMDFLSGMGATAAANWLPQNVAWGDEDGDRHSYTMPGIVNGVLQMGTLLPGEQPMLEAAESAYLMGKRNANIAAKLDPDNLSKWAERGNIAGDVVGQMPVGGAGLFNKLKFASPVANLMMDAAAAPFDYLGPFIHATPRNYGFAIGGGLALNEALPPAIGGMMSLAEKYGLGSDTPIDADESDRLLASLGFEGAGSKITDAAFSRARDASLASDRYATLEAAKEAAHEASQKAAARERMASMVYGSLPRYGKGQLFKNVEKAVKGNGRSTIKGAERKAYPGIYRDPKELVTEASLQIPSESPALQQLFGVNRRDLADMALAREATEWLPPGAPSRGRGSAHAAPVMHDANTDRLVNALNAAKGTDLGIGMQGWYMMDPAYQRLEVLYGPDEAKMMYDKFNTLTGIHSANSSVLTELNRGSAANWLDSEGRLGDYINYGGSMGVEGRPDDMAGVVGHMAHKTAHLLPAIRYLSSGVLSKEAKTPSYIAASQLPGMGNNVNFPVGDAHFSRAIGLADTRPGDTSDIYGKSWSMPEAMQLHEWFTKDVAGEAGMQGVPAQATLWGVYAPQTGVKTSIGVPKLELLADMIMKTAKRLDVSPERARDLVLSGRAHAGFVDPELLGLMGLGGVGAAAAIGMKGDEDAKAMGGLVEKYGALTE
jgi:hypothetical protein